MQAQCKENIYTLDLQSVYNKALLKLLWSNCVACMVALTNTLIIVAMVCDHTDKDYLNQKSRLYVYPILFIVCVYVYAGKMNVSALIY